MGCWLWYPGDFELYHGMLQNLQREERGYGWPAYWHMDGWRHHVLFSRTLEAAQDTRITVRAEGVGHVRVDGKKYPFGTAVGIPAGTHTVEIDVASLTGLPAAFVDGEEGFTDTGWMADDFLEKAPAGTSPLYRDPDMTPAEIPYRKLRCLPESEKAAEGGTLYDFGRMVNGEVTLRLKGARRMVEVNYGESETEALDSRWCYYREENAESGQALRKRAFRYLYLPGVAPGEAEVSACHEEFPFDCRAAFHSNDALVNDIWHISKETFHLCSGLFFIDGVKRDRWIWSGDAYQSYFVNQYLFFDEEINKRTIRALRGNTPITQHLNTIVDYSMLWLISLENHYWMTGDRDFLAEMYPKMQALMALLRGQLNPEGFIYGRKQDWIYIDWAEMDKDGVLCAEQILLWRCCRTMAFAANELGRPDEGYAGMADRLKEKIQAYFWNDRKKAFIDTYESGRNNVTRHANIFAVLFDFAQGRQAEEILNHVLLNDAVPAITTPYFKFFELDMWGKAGRLDIVWDTMRSYWGGMVSLGAKTFWEQYDPNEKGSELYAMYGDPYGKSLCHAWAASPIYLLGRYFLGVRPLTPGYGRFEVAPRLERFSALECDVPVKGGAVHISWKDGALRVTATRPGGTLLWGGESAEIPVSHCSSIN